METRDARSIKSEAQEELRRQAIKLLQQGMAQQKVADVLDASRRAVVNWWNLYQSSGWSALKKRKRGRKAGVHARLTQLQEKEVQKLICDKTPDQLKMHFALWSREAVQSLIEQRYGERFSLQYIGVLLKRWGFTPQRPLSSAQPRCKPGCRRRTPQWKPRLRRKTPRSGGPMKPP